MRHLQPNPSRCDGHDVIELSLGGADIPTPDNLIEGAYKALRDGRTGYTDGQGEPALRAALAARYTRNTGRDISPEMVMCFPGTQTSLFAVINTIVGVGDEILVGDPMYATYEPVIASSGATLVPVPLLSENGFHMSAADLEPHITENTTAIFLNTPHNPTGAILTEQGILEIGALATKHDLWILSDEVYEEMVFEDSTFFSPLAVPELADRTIVVSSISKAFAAPGFRSGWCVSSEKFGAHLLP